MTTPATPEFNFEVQHKLVRKEALLGGFVSMSFAGAIIEVVGDGVTLVLR